MYHLQTSEREMVPRKPFNLQMIETKVVCTMEGTLPSGNLLLIAKGKGVYPRVTLLLPFEPLPGPVKTVLLKSGALAYSATAALLSKSYRNL